MRIDPAVCHKILVAIEGDPNAGSGQFLRIEVEGYDATTVAHHIKDLWDSELLEGRDVTNMQSRYPEIMVQDITPSGRAYLDEREPDPPRRRMGF
jgi:hypothetical protein